jgi:hypothetical protein
LEKELNHWKTRYEVAQAFIDLTREQERRLGKEEKKKKRKGPEKEVLPCRSNPSLASVDDGASDGDQHPGPEEVEKEE